MDKQADAKGRLKAAQEDLDAKLDAKYPKLTEDEIKSLVVDDKWLATLAPRAEGTWPGFANPYRAHPPTRRRYATPLPKLIMT